MDECKPLVLGVGSAVAPVAAHFRLAFLVASLALFAYVVYHMMQCLFAALASSALASVRADTTRVYFLAGGGAQRNFPLIDS